MLSRGNSDAAIRLRHSKSSSSVQKHRHAPSQRSIDSKIAHQHAITAAARAMRLAQDRSSASTEDKITPIVQRREIRAKNAPPFKIRRRAPETEFENQILTPVTTPAKSLDTLAPFTPSPRTTPTNIVLEEVPQNPSLLQLPSHLPMLFDSPGAEFEESLRVASTPSSYRRIRRSKSMFSEQNPPPRLRERMSFIDRKSKSSVHEPEVAGHALVKLRRSMSVLKLGSRHKDRDGRQDQAVQAARDNFLHDVNQQRLMRKPSFFNRPRMPLGASARKGSIGRFGRPIASSNRCVTSPKGDAVKSKARVPSTSFRDRFRKALGLATSSKPAFPPQQLNASRAHFRDYDETTPEVSGSCELGRSRIPSLESQYLQSVVMLQGEDAPKMAALDCGHDMSLKGMGVESSHRSNSRVTSWTDSTVTDTAAMASLRQASQLSSIQENPNTTFEDASSSQRNRYSVFKRPLRSQHSSGRLYSALMKRLYNEPEGSKPVSEIPDYEGTEQLSPVLLEDSSHCVTSSKLSCQGPVIRRVADDAGAGRNMDGQLLTCNRVSSAPVHSQRRTPQQMADEAEETLKSKPSRRLREARSSFFPCSEGGAYPAFTSPSPFRKALAQRNVSPSPSENSLSSVIIHKPQYAQSSPDSASIYSRSQTGSYGNQPSGTGLDRQQEDGAHGMATILHSSPISFQDVEVYRPALNPATGQRLWTRQEWAHNSSDTSKPLHFHSREHAQIGQDDDFDAKLGAMASSLNSCMRKAFDEVSELSEDTSSKPFHPAQGGRRPPMELKGVQGGIVASPERAQSRQSMAASEGEMSVESPPQRIYTAPSMRSLRGSRLHQRSQIITDRNPSNQSHVRFDSDTIDTIDAVDTKNTHLPSPRKPFRPEKTPSPRPSFLTFNSETEIPYQLSVQPTRMKHSPCPLTNWPLNTENLGVKSTSESKTAGKALNKDEGELTELQKASISGNRRLVSLFLNSRRHGSRGGEASPASDQAPAFV